jgi:hypothetical protein
MERPVSCFFGISVLSFFGLIAASQMGHAGEGTPAISLETLEKRVAALEKKGPPLELEFHGVMAGAIQSSFIRDVPSGYENATRGGFVFQPELSIRPTQKDKFGVKFGFAAGNSLNTTSPFQLSTWAADLEDDVIDINGGKRSYLLTAWYKRAFSMGGLAGDVTGGIIDATDYLDENAYANDEFTQFMNEALVNSSNGFAPSFDLGGAMRLNSGPFSFGAVAMRVPKDEHDHVSQFYGAQVGARAISSLGEGNVRVSLETTDKECPTDDPNVKKARKGILISADQALGETWGVWTRVGAHNKGVPVNYRYLYSGGVNMRGHLWNRPGDDVGLGRAVLDKGTNGVSRSEVTELYIRFPLDEVLALRLDAQYLIDHRTSNDPAILRGWVTGLTLAATF